MEKLVFFIPNLGKGGAEKILVNIANSIVAKGKLDVSIILVQKEGFYLSSVNSNIEIIDLKSKHSICSVFKLTRYLRNNKSRIHLFSFLGYANISAILAAYLSLRRASIDLIVSERNHIPWGSDLKSKVVFFFQKVLYKYCDAVVAISPSITNEIHNLLNVNLSKIFTIPNPLILSNKLVYNQLLFNHDEINIVSAGRLIQVKDFPLLIKAFSLISIQKRARLWILGEGPDKESLQKLTGELKVKDKVMFQGFVDNPISYFEKADVYVCSSISEGFANVILEAMSAKTRIVSMTCGGPDEILENGIWGVIVSERKPQALAEGILQSLRNEIPDYTKRLRDYDINIITEKYEQVLN